jgi:multidrug transporter EmrE-like cation transporter
MTDLPATPAASAGPGQFLPLVGLAVLLRSLAAIFAKQAALTSVGGGLAGMVVNPWLVAEVVVLGLQALVWSSVLRKAPLSVAYPFLGLTFAINLVAAGLIFDETVQAQHVAGVALIVLGVLVMGLETGRQASSRS